jgi:serine/threonine-protein kinase
MSEQPPIDRSDPAPASRYQLLGEIARGAVAAVLLARDTDIGRDVAVKVLLDCHADQPELLQRFVEEAQIAGQLQHPGIVPIYEVGQFPDGRPFFSMKLVKGQTLSTLLAQRKEPSEDLPRFLAVFQQICWTLAYAHARGVINRDLKPAHVMIGAFGEVQVMDWGLARVLPRGFLAGDEAGQQHEPEGLTEVPTPRSVAPGTETEAARVLGTPAYMAPEQALGEIHRLDERADVFSLGAILCEILTGQPPWVGNNREQVHRQARRADLTGAFARLDRCGADPDLVALARRCLAVDRESRPRHAVELAGELSNYLQQAKERLRQAEQAWARAEGRATEERKRRRVQLALAVAVLGLFGFGIRDGLYLHRQHELRGLERTQRQQEIQAVAETTLEKADGLQRQARWAEARALLEQLTTQLGEAPQELRARVEQALADVVLVGELEAIRWKKAAVVDNAFDFAGADRDYAAVFREHGLAGEGEDTDRVAERLRGSPIQAQLVAALDHWASTTRDDVRRTWLLEVARRVDPGVWSDRFRDPAVWRDRAALERLAREAPVATLSPQLLGALAEALSRGGADPVPLLKAAQRGHPRDFWLAYLLGNALEKANPAEAVRYYRAAFALRPTAGH